MALRVAIGNNKGGGMKTTNTVRLAEALAKRGRRVGVVDMDPQGNASRRLGWQDNPQDPPLTTSEAIAANAVGVASQVWQPIGWDVELAERIVLMPARYSLQDRETEAGQRGAWRRLAKALQGADDHLDYVLMDLQPTTGHLTQMALAAAHYALVGARPEYDSVEAAVRFRDFVLSSGEDLGNPDIGLLGVVVGEYDMRDGGHVGQLANLRELFEGAVWGVVPRRSLLAKADEEARPLSELAGSHEIRAVYELLAERFEKEVTPA